MKMMKRVFSIVLVMTLLCTLLPGNVFAFTSRDAGAFTLTNVSVEMDGTSDKEVTLHFASKAKDTYVMLEGFFPLTDASGKIQLSAMTPAYAAGTNDNYVNTTTGKFAYFDGNLAGMEVEAGAAIVSATYTIPADTQPGDYTITVTEVNAMDAAGNELQTATYTATITVAEPVVPAGDYEIYYLLKDAEGNVVADDDNDALSKFGVGDTVTAEIFMVSNTATVTLQAYDIFLNYADELIYHSEDMAGVAYTAGATVGSPAVAGDKITHISLVDSVNRTYTLTQGQAVSLGTVSFTIDADAAVYGEAMNITLVQAEDITANGGKQEDVTNFSVGTASAGDKQSYYPAVTGAVDGAEVDTQWTVTWKNEDGTVLDTTAVGHGQMPSYTGQTPTKAMDEQYSYTHNGWDPTVVAAKEDAVYTATFEATTNSYTVIWKNWDGEVLLTESVLYGETPSYTGDTPEKTEDEKYTYTFAGWDPEISEVVGAVEYTAVYTPVAKEYTITFDVGEGSLPEGVDNPMTYTCDDTDNLPEPALEGYVFNGWKVEATVGNWNAGIYYSVDTVNGKYGNVTLVADWIDVEFVVNCAPSENGSVIPSPAGGAEGDTILLTLRPDAGYELDKLVYTYVLEGTETEVEITANENGVYSFQLPAADVTVTAAFKKASLAVSVDTENVAHGTVTPSVESTVLGETVTLTNSPETGYILVEYTVTYTDDQGLLRSVEVAEDGSFVMPAYPVTVTASFRLIKYTITFHANNGTGTMADMVDVEYNTELALSLNEFVRTGYVFLGWSLDPNATDKTYVDQQKVKNLTATEGEQIVLYAVWKADTFTITLHTNNGTINSGNVTQYTYGTVTQLPTDVTKEGFVFAGWYTDAELTQGPVAAILATDSGNKEYYAKWNRIATVVSEDYIYAASDYVMIRVEDNILSTREYRFNGVSMFWTDDVNYLVDTADTGVFYLLVEAKYIDASGNLTAEGEELLTVVDLETGKTRTEITYDGDINGDGVLNIADANIVYQMVQNGGGYYTGDHDLTMEQRLKADMYTASVNGDKRGTLDDVHAIVNLING